MRTLINLSGVVLRQKINELILNIYKRSSCDDLITFREHICESLIEVLPFDTISWDYLDNKERVLATIFSPLFENEKSLPSPKFFTLNRKIINPYKYSQTNLITIKHDAHQLTASFAACTKQRGQQIKIIRKANNQQFTSDDTKLFELISLHMMEGLSMVLMNSFKKSNNTEAMGIIDKNHNVIEANQNFFILFSSVIKNNKLLLSLVIKQQLTSIKNIKITVTQIDEFYILHARIEKHQELTTQEYKVMTLLATGESNNSMAEKLQISASTINNHLTHIFNKLGVNSRISAVKEWKKHDK